MFEKLTQKYHFKTCKIISTLVSLKKRLCRVSTVPIIGNQETRAEGRKIQTTIWDKSRDQVW